MPELASFVVLLEKEPAMAFEIFRPISSPWGTLLDLGEDQCACRSRSCEVSIKIIHNYEHAVDNPGHTGPLARLFADLSVAFRTAVIWRRTRKHDRSGACHHLAVLETPVRRSTTTRLTKPGRVAKPFQRRDPILVGDHRDNG